MLTNSYPCTLGQHGFGEYYETLFKKPLGVLFWHPTGHLRLAPTHIQNASKAGFMQSPYQDGLLQRLAKLTDDMARCGLPALYLRKEMTGLGFSLIKTPSGHFCKIRPDAAFHLESGKVFELVKAAESTKSLMEVAANRMLTNCSSALKPLATVRFRAKKGAGANIYHIFPRSEPLPKTLGAAEVEGMLLAVKELHRHGLAHMNLNTSAFVVCDGIKLRGFGTVQRVSSGRREDLKALEKLAEELDAPMRKICYDFIHAEEHPSRL